MDREIGVVCVLKSDQFSLRLLGTGSHGKLKKVPSFRSLVLHHGYSFLFCYVLAVQAGVPVPSDPVLLIMGASVGDGHYSLWIALIATVSAALLGDSLWYELGRW